VGFTLQIIPAPGSNELLFAGVQDFSYLNSGPAPGPQYVFYGDSADWISGQSSPPPIGGSVTKTVYATPNGGDTFVGLDSTNSGNPISLDTSNTPVLLAVLKLDASITNVGDVYTIGLVPSSGDGSMNSSTTTFFDHVNFNNGTEISSVPYTSTPGTVTITAASIPEPASIVMGLSAVALLAGARWVRGPWRSKRGTRRRPARSPGATESR
jgi:hypothetical protein